MKRPVKEAIVATTFIIWSVLPAHGQSIAPQLGTICVQEGYQQEPVTAKVNLPIVPASKASYSSDEIQLVEIDPNSDIWTTDPYPPEPGFSHLEAIAYGSPGGNPSLIQFPALPVEGAVTIPVFLVDWSDFDPTTDLSNDNNPNSVFPSYVKMTSKELDQHLNGAFGLGDYYRTISGGKLDITFRVHPWIESDSSTYIGHRASYLEASSPSNTIALDVLRSAVVDLQVDLTEFDADSNRILDGFAVVYEGHAGRPSGTNMSRTGRDIANLSPVSEGLRNVADLVSSADANHGLFETQEILFSRYVNMPEQNKRGEFTSIGIWAHEFAHLLLGVPDYYLGPHDLGDYALRARQETSE